MESSVKLSLKGINYKHHHARPDISGAVDDDLSEYVDIAVAKWALVRWNVGEPAITATRPLPRSLRKKGVDYGLWS